MKTVKRKAEVGERIRGTLSGRIGIVSDIFNDPDGDIVKFVDTWNGEEFFATHDNYEVIIEDGPAIPPHSSHYHPGSIDVIRFAEENFSVEERRGFYRMSALKYLTRFDRKGSSTDDLEKAQFYTGKLLELERHDQP